MLVPIPSPAEAFKSNPSERLATSPGGRARLRFRQFGSARESKEVRPRLTTAVP